MQIDAEATPAGQMHADMQKAPTGLRWINVDGASVDISRNSHLNLGTLSRVIGEDRERQSWLATNLREGKWFAEQLPPIIEVIAKERNKASHCSPISPDVITQLRNQLIGVGSEGELIKLARVCVGLRAVS